MITRDRFDHLKEKWSAFSSWAVWRENQSGETPKAGIGDLSVLDPDSNPSLLDTLNPDVVLVGLNAAARFSVSPQPWGNFHDGSGVANDFKIRFALQGTAYWGAYMTDVYIDLPETKSARVKAWTRENPDLVKAQLDRLERELADLGSPDPLLIAFGDLAYDPLLSRFGGTHEVVKVQHYSNYIGKENYRASVLEILEGVRRTS